MKQYHFTREDFVSVFNSVFSNSDVQILCDLSSVRAVSPNYHLFRSDDDFFILNFTTGVLIGWYKVFHIGRINVCNKEDFTLEDLRAFFTELRSEFIEFAQ